MDRVVRFTADPGHRLVSDRAGSSGDDPTIDLGRDPRSGVLGRESVAPREGDGATPGEVDRDAGAIQPSGREQPARRGGRFGAGDTAVAPERLHRARFSSTRASGTTDGGVDGWLVHRVARRVSLYALVTGLGFAGTISWYDLIPLFRGQPLESLFFLPGMLAATAACLATWAYLRHRGGRLSTILAVASGVQIVAALSVSVPIVPLAAIPESVAAVGIPWVCILIVLFPILVPAPPRLHLPIAALCASFWPIGEAVRGLLGLAHSPVSVTVQFSFATGLCAALSGLTSALIHRMERELRRARREARELGSYQLERRLGQGGMGEVWLAHHRMLARPAAIKLIIPDRLAESPEGAERTLDRFEREARATANLRSAHTVDLYDFGRGDDGCFYYAMELLDGIDLEHLVQLHGPLPPGRVVHILGQTCLSLGEAHGRRLVHRDVKPANIFLCRMGEECDVVKVLDFGLVRETADAGSALTGEHIVTGTPAFMAPEASRDPHSVDARTDIYALGCVGYWLLTGELVFDEPTTLATILAHVEKEPRPPSEVRGESLPPQLERAILDCLAKRPEERPPSAGDLRRRLLGAPGVPPWREADACAWWSEHPPTVP